MNPSIEILTEARLEAAIALAKSVFPHPDDHPEEALRAIFAPHRFRQYIVSHRIFDRICWTALTPDGKLTGLVGLYYYEPHLVDSIYLGWFCVDQAARRSGIGGALLDHAIGEARLSGATFLKLDTSVSAIAAQACYESRGLRIVGQDGDHIDREMRLRDSWHVR